MKVSLIPLAMLASFVLFLPACDQIKAKYSEFTAEVSTEEHTGEHAGGEHAMDEHVEGEHAEDEHAGDEHADGENHAADEGHGEGEEHSEGEHHAEHKIIVTSPIAENMVSTQRYVCQIHSRRHIEVCALEGGYLQSINVKEGQAVKKGDVIFNILPVLYQARLDAEKAEAQLVQVEFDNTQKLYEQKIVSVQEVKLAAAKLAKAQAKVELTQAEMDFADIKAPFDGIVGRQMAQQGSLIEEGDVLTTMSDNAVMWVYFNVPEARYLEYQAALDENKDAGDLNIELELANHKLFPQKGEIGAIEADFNNETGNIAFRGDFPNPKNLLRHGQTGTMLVHRILENAVVIPQRATFEVLAKQYVYIVGEDHVVHPSEIEVADELDDLFVISDGVKPGDKIVLEGILQVHDGEKIEYEYREPKEVLANLKSHAE